MTMKSVEALYKDEIADLIIVKMDEEEYICVSFIKEDKNISGAICDIK